MKNNPYQEIAAMDGEYRPLGPPLGREGIGERADGFLSRQFPFLSRAGWQKRIEDGQLLVSGRRIRPSYRLREGDALMFFHPQEVEPEVDRNVYPLWRRGGVMAVYKPGNLPMHEAGPYRFNTFAHIIKEVIGEEWAAVHRLDRETSGIVLCGNTYESRQMLADALYERSVSKEYLAIAQGAPPADEWVEEGPIGDLVDSAIRIKRWVVPNGQSAETWFKVLACKGDYVLLSARPKTGRTNQIRIHAAVNGLPLVGDKLYHPDENVFLQYFESGNTEDVIDQAGFRRLCLHATAITFRHPETNDICRVTCPMPEDMVDFWESLNP